MRLVRPALPTVLKAAILVESDDEALQRMAQNGCVVVPAASVGVSFRTLAAGPVETQSQQEQCGREVKPASQPRRLKKTPLLKPGASFDQGVNSGQNDTSSAGGMGSSMALASVLSAVGDHRDPNRKRALWPWEGSFTGADRRRDGHIERADGGTLFLDEITEMRSDAQAKLLRVIEQKSSSRGRHRGDTDRRAIPRRVEPPSEAGYRRGALARGPLLPSKWAFDHTSASAGTRRRLAPVGRHFIRQANHDYCRKVEGIDRECSPALRRYRWPGNIRELHNVVVTAVLLAPSHQISINELPAEIRASTNRENSFLVYLGFPLAEIEKEYIRRTIAFVGGNKSRASKMLRVPRRTLYGKLERQAMHETNGRLNANGYHGPRNGMS